MQLLWLSDIHLNFMKNKTIAKFIASLTEWEPDAIVITGDISTGNFVRECLEAFIYLQLPVYFVLGNHDFYGRDIDIVREVVSDVSPNVIYLHRENKLIHLTDASVLVGVDGWADGAFGDWENSTVSEQLNDFFQIGAFIGESKNMRLFKMQELARDSHNQLLSNLVKLNSESGIKHVYIATHVPPFRRSCIHEGHISEPDWLPLFSCKMVGDLIREYSQQHKDIQFHVMCGHTHSVGECQIEENLWVSTAYARYSTPAIQKIFMVE